jgi:predicted anti-sigma-YlaC factor YlaD
MNTTAPDLTRSEAFVEDLGPLTPPGVDGSEADQRLDRSLSRWARYVPLAVGLMGLAFAVLPPL